MTNKTLWIVIIVVITGLFFAWRSQRPVATVEVVRPIVQTIDEYVEERAVTELPHDALISMPIDGWVEPITLREGDVVTAQQVVARLEQDDLRDRFSQAEQRIAILETEIASTADHRLEQHMLEETHGVVKAIRDMVKAAEAQLEGSLAMYEFARSEVDRLKELSEKDVVAERELSTARRELRRSRADYDSDVLELASLRTIEAVSFIGPKFVTDYIDRKSFDLESSRRQLDEARSQLAIVRRNVERAELTSPVAGVVLERFQSRRQFLRAGTPLLSIGRLEDLEVIAEVLTERAPRIKPGARVEILGESLANEIIPGRVNRVYPAGFKKISSLGIEQQRVKVAIDMDECPVGLGVGFRVHVRIIYEHADDTLTIPRSCLFRDTDNSWRVMVVEDERVKLRQVDIGLKNDDRAQITNGLATEDRILLHPSTDIAPGDRVTIAD